MRMPEIWFRKGFILYNAGVFTHESTFFDKIRQKIYFHSSNTLRLFGFFYLLMILLYTKSHERDFPITTTRQKGEQS